MKSLLLYLVLTLLSINAYPQCAYEKVLSYYVHNITGAKIIELKDRASLIGITVSADTTTTETTGNRDILLIKNDSCGNIIWQEQYSYNETSFDDFVEIIELANGDLLMLASSQNDGIGGFYNIIVWKLSASGNVLWTKYYGGDNSTSGHSITFNKNRNSLLIAGYLERPGLQQRGYLLEIDTAGNIMHEREVIMNSVAYSAKARVACKYAYALPDATIMGIVTSEDFDSVYAVKLDSSFNILWKRYPLIPAFQNVVTSMSINTNRASTKLALYFSTFFENYTLELDTAANIIQYAKRTIDIIPSGSSQSLVPTNNNGYILGYDLLILDSNLQQQSFTKFPEDVTAQAYCQMRNGAIVYAGYKNINNKYLKGYIAQTNAKGWILGNEEVYKKTEPEISIYPNPANSSLTVQSSIPYQTIKVYSIAGQQVLIQSYLASTQVDVSALPQGLYVLQLLNDQGSIIHSQKIGVQR
jgi:hypothetical protein